MLVTAELNETAKSAWCANMALLLKSSNNAASLPHKCWLPLKKLAPPALTPKLTGNASRRCRVSFGARTKPCR